MPKLFARAAALLLASFAILPLVVPALPAEAAVSSWQQKAVVYYPQSTTDFGSSNFQTTLTHYKSLGFNTVTLIIQLYQSNDTSTDIGAGWNTPTDASIVSAIQYAHSIGMKVMLNIHDDPDNGDWRANINPSDRSTWYANYLSELEHYAQLAQQNSVEFYCLGTEMVSVASPVVNTDNTQEWQNMIAQIRKIYSGKLTYDANWGSGSFADEVDAVQFWPQLDFIGISAYYPLSGSGSVADDENSWSSWQSGTIGPLESRWNKPILFTEIGYRSVSGAHNAPYDYWTQANYDAQEQVNDYQALLDFWNNYSYMQGIDVWYVISDPSAGGSGDTNYYIMNKPVEQTFQSWFLNSNTGGNGGSTGSGSTPSGPAPAFTIFGSANPSSVSANQPVTLACTVNDTGGTGANDNVDLEVYDSNNHQVYQQTYSNQNFSANGSQKYSVNWTPTSNGTYTFKVGVFDSNWNLYIWDNAVAAVTVGSNNSSGGSTSSSTGSTGSTGGSTSSTTPPANPIMDIWWPTNGTTISGLQPFKALIEGLALPSYSMFWQVDGGQLNQMSDNQTDYPHKESEVDLSGWNWEGNNPYNINFIAKDTNGNTITQKSVSVYVSH